MATMKQKQAFSKIYENHGNISKTMKEVGYTETSAQNPKNLTESKGWKELMEEYLPDSLLVKKHLELLNKVEKESGEINIQAVSKGLEMAYKLKGVYTPEKKEHSGSIVFMPSSLLERHGLDKEEHLTVSAPDELLEKYGLDK